MLIRFFNDTLLRLTGSLLGLVDNRIGLALGARELGLVGLETLVGLRALLLRCIDVSCYLAFAAL